MKRNSRIFHILALAILISLVGTTSALAWGKPKPPVDLLTTAKAIDKLYDGAADYWQDSADGVFVGMFPWKTGATEVGMDGKILRLKSSGSAEVTFTANMVKITTKKGFANISLADRKLPVIDEAITGTITGAKFVYGSTAKVIMADGKEERLHESYSYFFLKRLPDGRLVVHVQLWWDHEPKRNQYYLVAEPQQ